jgi:prepilin-type N-terminal cleavage/methylation domain-containing protein
MLKKNTSDFQAGFTLIEILISVALLIGLALLFSQVVLNSNQSNKRIENSSLFEKALISQVLEMRMASFDAIQELVERGTQNAFTCGTNTTSPRFPSDPTPPEKILYTWRPLGFQYEFCIDINSFEYEAQQNIMDIKFRATFRNKQNQKINENDTKFVVMRRGR